MCGIAVAIDWEGAESAVRTLIQGILQRGDVTDPVVSPRPGAALCTRRLRIVDRDRAAQPMASPDGRLLVAFNGEIYNHAELRAELVAAGVRLKTASDTEVLAAALSVWGARAIPRFEGMYAFVALDLATGDFLAARDPLGVKPLYVVQSGKGFLFCSEIKPLLNATEAGDVLLVPPGHVLTRTVCAPLPTALNQPTPEGDRSPEALDRILERAVERRVPPDLPFALMFSGGIDSTLVAHYARRLRPEAPAYFVGAETAPDYPFAAAYAELVGMDLRTAEIPQSACDLAPLAGEIISVCETFEPCIIRSAVGHYLLARRIEQDGYRVALCGEGADELFAGYEPLEVSYRASEAAGILVRNQYLSEMNRGNLQRLDRCGMRFGIETREPFLDRDVIGHALGVPARELLETIGDEARGKAPLRRLYDLHPDVLPRLIRDRRKSAFSEGAGIDRSYTASPWADLVEEAVSDSDLAEGRRRFSGFAIADKEELYNLQRLSEVMDVERVPHLKGRMTLQLEAFDGAAELDLMAAS